MNDDELERPWAPHPFFHTMVVMGSALALACGGMSEGTAARPGGTGDAAGGNEGSGAASDGMGGTTASAGGSRATAASGGGAGTAQGASGGAVASTGGSAAAPGSGGAGGSGIGGELIGGAGGTAGALACAPAQWSCTLTCNVLSSPSATDCHCDETQPKTEADCAVDQSFACVQADAETRAGIDCHCVPKQADCGSTCSGAFGEGRGHCLDSTSSGSSVLCGCAIIVLK